MTSFAETIAAGFGFDGPAVTLGGALHDGAVSPQPPVRLPLRMLTRHGLVAGATGTGKTRTLQLMAEQVAAAGVPVFVADLKGDLAGLAAPGEASTRLTERAASLEWTWTPAAAEVEFMSLSGALGAPLRATVSGFGPLLLAKVLDLNETQTGVLAVLFKWCDQQGLPVLDVADLEAVVAHLMTDEGREASAGMGGLSRASLGVIQRKLVELEARGGRDVFGEPEFDVRDLLHVAGSGRGIIMSLELADVQDRPRVFSTMMMWLLAELYQVLPEAGDLDKPKLVFFFDEAHLLFRDAPKAFLEQVEQVIRLIRSKGVGVFFVTQVPGDVPDAILAQLGNRVQHALRAHTPKDDAALRATARTYPKTPWYDLEETLTTLGTGEAVVSVLAPDGRPAPVVATRLVPPASRMAPLTAAEFQAELAQGDLQREYGTPVDRESAHEMLARRMAEAKPAEPKATGRGRGAGKTIVATMAGTLAATFGRTIAREVARDLMGMLGMKGGRGTTRRR